MAYLSLQTIGPVDFGGKECTPKIDAETKLRLAEVKKYDSYDLGVIAAAFPDDEEYVKNFLGKMATIDVQILHAYLLGGPTMVEKMRGQMDSAINVTAKEAK